MSMPDAVERRAQALSSRRPSLVFARDDSSASDKVPAEATRILIVEDDYLVAMQIEAALQEAGMEAAGIAATAEEAIELAVSEHPALAVMDIRLAGRRDGIDAALVLFREHGIRCVFASAHYDPDTRTRAEPALPLGWLRKPYTMISLVETVRRALSDLNAGKT